MRRVSVAPRRVSEMRTRGSAAMKYCDEPGCGTMLDRGARCSTHARAVDQVRGSFRQRGYNARWDRRSRLFRARYPLCGMRPGALAPVMSRCYDEHRVTVGDQVDHIAPHRGDSALFWDELGNWQTLCSACHTRKTAAGL
jgi:5-methylcytosine-specific restriction protein A